MSINNKTQVLITDIKSRMQCFIYQVPSKKHENFCKTWALKTYESTQTQIALQDTKK